MKRIFIGILLLATTCVTVSAQHYYYVPNSINMPVLKKPNNAGVSFGFGSGGGINTTELQSYYSPRKSVAVMFNYMGARDRSLLGNNHQGMNFHLYEIGAGLYEVQSHGSASLWGGIGLANAYNYFALEKAANLNLVRGFLQSDIHYQDKFFQTGIGLRLSRVKYSKGRVAVDIPADDLAAIVKIEEQSAFFLPELSVNAGVRFSPVTFSVQFTAVYRRTDNYKFAHVNSSASLLIALADVRPKRSKKAPEM